LKAASTVSYQCMVYFVTGTAAFFTDADIMEQFGSLGNNDLHSVSVGTPTYFNFLTEANANKFYALLQKSYPERDKYGKPIVTVRASGQKLAVFTPTPIGASISTATMNAQISKEPSATYYTAPIMKKPADEEYCCVVYFLNGSGVGPQCSGDDLIAQFPNHPFSSFVIDTPTFINFANRDKAYQFFETLVSVPSAPRHPKDSDEEARTIELDSGVLLKIFEPMARFKTRPKNTSSNPGYVAISMKAGSTWSKHSDTQVPETTTNVNSNNNPAQAPSTAKKFSTDVLVAPSPDEFCCAAFFILSPGSTTIPECNADDIIRMFPNTFTSVAVGRPIFLNFASESNARRFHDKLLHECPLSDDGTPILTINRHVRIRIRAPQPRNRARHGTSTTYTPSKAATLISCAVHYLTSFTKLKMLTAEQLKAQFPNTTFSNIVVSNPTFLDFASTKAAEQFYSDVCRDWPLDVNKHPIVSAYGHRLNILPPSTRKAVVQ
jgi:hypothetical protein